MKTTSPPDLPADHEYMVPDLPVSSSSIERPTRPKNFPLFAHRVGQWAKKVRGRTLYFGPWKQPDLALARWTAWKDDLLAGRPVRPIGGGEITLKELCNDFLTTKEVLRNEGLITPRTWREYKAASQRLCSILGKDLPVPSLSPADFETLRITLGKKWGPVRLGDEIQRMRTIFRHGLQHRLIDQLPTYGTSFQKPSRAILRKARSAKGARMFEATDLQKLLASTGPTMKAMILLGINCGLGNTDVAGLRRKHLDLKKGWINYPRQKTGVDRRGKLWPETVAAIRAVLKARGQKPITSEVKTIEAEVGKTVTSEVNTLAAKPRTNRARRAPPDRRLVFLTREGRSWAAAESEDPISNQMLKLTKRCKVWRPGLGFYALRHTFETIGGECGDQPAVNHIMGHVARSDDMSAVYRERMLDTRLAAVADHVHAWLFGSKDEGKK